MNKIWTKVLIDECCNILNSHRKPLNSDERSRMKGSYPYYGANGVQGYINKYMLDGDFILLAEDGGYFDEYATRPIAYKVSGKCWVNNHAHVLQAKENFSQDFIFYSLVHKNITSVIKGGTRSKLNLSELKSVKLSFPADNVQKKIASILSTIDAQIEKTEAIIDKYQAIKQGMLHDLFTRGIDVITGKLRPTYEQAPKLYKPSVLGMIPKDWQVEQLGKCCGKKADYGINAPAVEYSHSLPAYLRITDISENGQLLSQDKRSVADVNASNYFLEPGDIVFARTGATVGKTYLYSPLDGVLVFAGFLIRFKPDPSTLLATFLKFFTEMGIYKSWVTIMSTRSGQPGINGNEYASLCLPLPSIKEQELICAKVLSVSELIAKESKFSQKLQSLKQGLMSDLLSGKIPITINESEAV